MLGFHQGEKPPERQLRTRHVGGLSGSTRPDLRPVQGPGLTMAAQVQGQSRQDGGTAQSAVRRAPCPIRALYLLLPIYSSLLPMEDMPASVRTGNGARGLEPIPPSSAPCKAHHPAEWVPEARSLCTPQPKVSGGNKDAWGSVSWRFSQVFSLEMESDTVNAETRGSTEAPPMQTPWFLVT